MQTFRFESGPIEEVSWGRFVINGKEHAKQSDGTIVGVGKDICLINDQLYPWSARKGHLLTTEMVECVAKTEVNTVIIGNGFYGALTVPEEVQTYLQNQGKTVIVEPTPEACKRFNALFRQGEKVALLAHGTC